jgi:predicted nucleic acid-binding protein
MNSIFIDTNVWFSAFYGSLNSQKIITAHATHQIQAVISQQVLAELFRNLKRKHPRAMGAVETFFSQTPPTIVKTPLHVSESISHLVHPLDAPLLQACHHAQITYFVTDNLKHFKIDSIKKALEISILSPSQTIKQFKL